MKRLAKLCNKTIKRAALFLPKLPAILMVALIPAFTPLDSTCDGQGKPEHLTP